MSPDNKDSVDRSTSLEIKIAALEHDVATLNEVVIRQDDIIRTLQDGYKLLLRRIEALEPPEDSTMGGERPPHY